ncbi:hypothetical protein GCM10020331_087740 [Ectobacillus funiculus]
MLEVRKVYTVVEETKKWKAEKEVTPPILNIAALAVLRNPWHGREYVEDLKTKKIFRICASIGGNYLSASCLK